MYSIFMDGVRLPVAPSKISTKIKNMNKTLTLMDGGELNLLKAPGLTEIDFDVDIPAQPYPFAIYDGGFKPAEYYLAQLERLKVSGAPFRLIITRMRGRSLLYETNLLVSLEAYSPQEDAKNGADVKVKIQLKQYVERRTRRIEMPETAVSQETTTVIAAASEAPARQEKATPRTYTVQAGDTLWKICARELGDGNRYPEIAKLNGISNPNVIYPGQVIKFE